MLCVRTQPRAQRSLLSCAGKIGTPGQSGFRANSYWLLKDKSVTTGSPDNPQHSTTSENTNWSSNPGLPNLQRKRSCEESSFGFIWCKGITRKHSIVSGKVLWVKSCVKPWSPVVQYICRCHHKVVKFQEFLRKIAFSRQQQESVSRVKRGKTTAESPSGANETWPKEEQNLRRRTWYRAPQQIAFSHAHQTNLRKLDHGQYFLHLHQNVTGKNESLQRELNLNQRSA